MSGIVDFFGDGSGVALYEFEGNTNDSGGQYDAAATDVTYQASPVGGQCASFNGVSSYVALPMLIQNTQTFSVSMYINSSDNQAMALALEPYSGASAGTSLAVAVGGFMGSNWVVDTYNTESVRFSVPLGRSLLAWDHIVASLTPTSLTVYLNGQLVGSVPTTGTRPAFHSDANLGGRVSGGWWFAGQIDEVRFFNRALNDKEALKLFLREASLFDVPISTLMSTLPASLSRGFR